MPTKKYHPDYVNSLRKKIGCRFPSFFSCNKSWEAEPRLLEVWVGHNGCIQCDWESSHCHSASIANFHSPLPSSWMVLRWFNCVGKTCFHQPLSFFNTSWNMFEFREIEDAIVFSNESFLYHFSIAIKRHFKKTGWNKKHFISTFPPPHPLGETLQHPRLQWVPFVSAAYWPHNDCRKDEFRSSPQTAKSMEKHMFFHGCFHEKYWLKCPQRWQTTLESMLDFVWNILEPFLVTDSRKEPPV